MFRVALLSAVVGGGLPSCGGRPPRGLFVSRVLLGLSDWAVWAVLSCVVSTFEVYVMFLPLSELCGAAASSLLFGGLGDVRGLDGLWGVAFLGAGACDSWGWGHSYLNPSESEEDFLIETLGLIKQSYFSYFLFCFS